MKEDTLFGNMSSETVFLLWLCATIIGLVITYFFLHYATGAADRKKQLKIQNKILIQIAEKQGVGKDALDLLSQQNDEV